MSKAHVSLNRLRVLFSSPNADIDNAVGDYLSQVNHANPVLFHQEARSLCAVTLGFPIAEESDLDIVIGSIVWRAFEVAQGAVAAALGIEGSGNGLFWEMLELVEHSADGTPGSIERIGLNELKRRIAETEAQERAVQERARAPK